MLFRMFMRRDKCFRARTAGIVGHWSRLVLKVFNKQLSGLGNQLFQYAAGLYFADRYHGQLSLIPEPVEGTVSYGYPRPFLLSKFAISAPVRRKTWFDEQMLTPTPRYPHIRSGLQRLCGVAVRNESVEQRFRFLEDLQLPSGTQVLYLAGYWQVYRFAEAIETRLREELCLREAPPAHNQRVLDQIRAAPVSVSLHLRRGDYTLAAHGNIALPLSYYYRAVEMMRQRFDKPAFFIFSDDLEFARKSLPAVPHQVFVEGNDSFSAQEDLRLMSACQHHIIANSSFSWWGAWLNPNPEKVVIAPRHWDLSPTGVYPDLLPPTWHALDSLRDS